MKTSNSVENSPKARRVVSIDVFRGLVMFLMLAEVLHLSSLADKFPDSPSIELLRWLKFHTTHVAWQGCSLHDLIQPGFTFLVGVALPFSLASRRAKGHSLLRMGLHALWRGILLILLGVFLRSLGKSQTNWTFEDTLTQIGLGYFLLFLIGLLPKRGHYLALVLVLVGSWGLFAASPAPPATFDYEAVGVPADWPHHESGLASRWNKNSNVAWKFDVWFLNQFPRETPFAFNRGGYSTLNFLPTLATMIFGLLAGSWMKDIEPTGPRVVRFLLAIGICLLAGWGISELGFCPLVKRIWTPTFTLWSAGWCFLFLLLLHLMCDVAGLRGWAFPLIVIGSNSILIYVMSWTMKTPIQAALQRHLGQGFFEQWGPAYAPLLLGMGTLLTMWLILLYLYRHKIFLRI